MILQTMHVGPLAVNCYIFGDDHSREVVVIDPGGNLREIVGTTKQLRLHVVGVVLTHAHFDHVMAVPGLISETGAPLMAGEAEEPILNSAESQGKAFGLAVQPLPAPDRWLKDGDEIKVGALVLRVLHTPGHTPGGICLWASAERVLFSGDTLMRGSIGRTDFPGGSMEEILKSIHGKLMVLPPETTVYPGHGPISTIGEEKRLNPFLKTYV